MSVAVRLDQLHLNDIETIRRYLCAGQEGRKIVTTARCLRFAISNAAMFVRKREWEQQADKRKVQGNGRDKGADPVL